MLGFAKPCRVLNQCIQNRLKIKRRAAYDFQNFAGRRLLVQSLAQITIAFLQFFEQPHILDGDHGLVGEGFEKGDLLLGERPNLRTADPNNPDCHTFSQQWHHKPGTDARIPRPRVWKFRLSLGSSHIVNVDNFSVDHSSTRR